MPTDKRKQSKATKDKDSGVLEYCDEIISNKSTIPPDESPAISTKKTKKRSLAPSPEESSNESDVESTSGVGGNENEMASILNSFGAEATKALSAKRKRLDKFTATTMKTSSKRYDEICAQQQTQREKITGEYVKQMSDVFGQWENDIHKSKDADDKTESIMRQLLKSMQQQRVIQNQRCLSLKNLTDQFSKGTSELSKIHQEQFANINVELRKELGSIQKKMMDESRQDEMLNVRKSLQSMLAQV